MLVPMTSSKLGDFLRARRKAQNLTQTQVRDALVDHGWRKYEDSAVAQWENGRALPPLSNPRFIRALASVLGVGELDILSAAGMNVDIPEKLPAEIVDLLSGMSPDQLREVRSFLRYLSSKPPDEPQQ